MRLIARRGGRGALRAVRVISPQALAFVFTTILAGAAAIDDPLAVIQKSAEDWNRGNIEAFVDSYERSSETTFVGTTVSRGTENILQRYRRSYPDRAYIGKLTFSELHPRFLTPELAIVTGRFTLDRTTEAGGGSTGLFTLVLRKGEVGWRIIHDHTSSGH